MQGSPLSLRYCTLLLMLFVMRVQLCVGVKIERVASSLQWRDLPICIPQITHHSIFSVNFAKPMGESRVTTPHVFPCGIRLRYWDTEYLQASYKKFLGAAIYWKRRNQPPFPRSTYASFHHPFLNRAGALLGFHGFLSAYRAFKHKYIGSPLRGGAGFQGAKGSLSCSLGSPEKDDF